MSEPKEFIKGETVSWTKCLSDYPADEWTLTYFFRGRTNGFDVTATAEGTDYLIEIPAIDGNPPGLYHWQAQVIKDDETYVVGAGRCEILPNFADLAVSAAYDPRTQIEKDLEAVKTMLSGKATKDVQEYTIGNRQLKNLLFSDLLALKESLTKDLVKERRAKRVKNGGKLFRTVHMRLKDA